MSDISWRLHADTSMPLPSAILPRWRQALLRWLRPDLDRVAYLAELQHLSGLATTTPPLPEPGPDRPPG
jgi:hypothetical protein